MRDIAGQRESSQAATAEGIAVEAEAELDEEVLARDPKVASRTIKPTQAMTQAHELYHADYRNGCGHCRAGKGVSHQHRLPENDKDDADFSLECAF